MLLWEPIATKLKITRRRNIPVLKMPVAYREAFVQVRKYIPELAGGRLTPKLVHHIFSLVAGKQMDEQRRLAFLASRGCDIYSTKFGTCCDKGIPSVIELPFYIKALEDILAQKPRIYGQFVVIERRDLHALVRHYKRRSQHVASWAFSCPNCKADKPIIIHPRTPRHLSLLVGARMIQELWGLTLGWLGLLNQELQYSTQWITRLTPYVFSAGEDLWRMRTLQALVITNTFLKYDIISLGIRPDWRTRDEQVSCIVFPAADAVADWMMSYPGFTSTDDPIELLFTRCKDLERYPFSSELYNPSARRSLVFHDIIGGRY